MSQSPLLDTVNLPRDLRLLDKAELPQLCAELRAFLLKSVSATGGHFASNLGAVELTVALHYVYNTPEDHLVWDVGHQSYPHKILTGRKNRMDTMRQYGGLAETRRVGIRRFRRGALVHIHRRGFGYGRGRQAGGTCQPQCGRYR